MLHLAGVPISDRDVRWLVAELNQDGYADAVHAALEIAAAAERGSFAAALTAEDRQAVLRLLVDPPEGSLYEIRGVLMRDSSFAS